LKLLVLAVGRLKEDHWRAAEEEYLRRLRRHAPVEVREVKDEAALLAALPPRARLVLLDERGAPWSSADLARALGDEELRGAGRPVAFAVGGADGFSARARARADDVLGFGRITLPHRLARIVLVEQLYRAFSILRGDPYHLGHDDRAQPGRGRRR
jgi:23S rRNA (pseudouridine1915-N3)-methyltransferase